MSADFHPPCYRNLLGPAQGEARIVIVAQKDDPTLKQLLDEEEGTLPPKACVLLVASTLEEFKSPPGLKALADANVLLNCIGNAGLLRELWPFMTGLKWISNRFAGVDTVLFPELQRSPLPLTNARGLFSSSLAEYVALAILYFSKDVSRWKAQQRAHVWDKFVIQEARGKTIGIIGYGDIGASCARLAKCLGMRVLAQRRRPELCEGDTNVDQVRATQVWIFGTFISATRLRATQPRHLGAIN
jgi:phosphoglycerate dehydrogenase-like enzyme